MSMQIGQNQTPSQMNAPREFKMPVSLQSDNRTKVEAAYEAPPLYIGIAGLLRERQLPARFAGSSFYNSGNGMSHQGLAMARLRAVALQPTQA